ncbi:partner of Y14 and mago isoform X3 [Nannospalax galili]|uniref:partner of Y14 and mago isoform X3 n=1 Tax=Nannospalax galili TaxID=1026970 RepID=UPI0004ED4C9C|nr:partner of Y14 and mago isoform X3 [Nannospalax galili]
MESAGTPAAPGTGRSSQKNHQHHFKKSSKASTLPQHRDLTGPGASSGRSKKATCPKKRSQCAWYENKYVKFFKSKPELPPGLSPEATTPITPSRPEGGEPGLSKTAKRNLKRKEKRRQQQEKGEAEALSRTLDKVSLVDTAQTPSALQGSQAAPIATSDPPDSAATTERAKKIKNLKKKLRQVEELQQRIQAGEVRQPSKEQLEKLARRRALEEELEDLELGL